MENGEQHGRNFRYSDIQQQLSGLLPNITFSSDEDEDEDINEVNNTSDKTANKTNIIYQQLLSNQIVISSQFYFGQKSHSKSYENKLSSQNFKDEDEDINEVLEPFFRENSEDLRILAHEVDEDFHLDMDFDIDFNTDNFTLSDSSRPLEMLPKHMNTTSYKDIFSAGENNSIGEVTNKTVQLNRNSSAEKPNSKGPGPKSLFFGLVDPGEEEIAKTRYLPPSDLTLRFGTRGDINLDEYFSDYPETPSNRPNLQCVDMDSSDTDESRGDNDLLNALTKMAQSYSLPNGTANLTGVPRKPRFNRFIPAALNKSKSKSSSKKREEQQDDLDSIRVNIKIPDTVHLDLRQSLNSNHSNSWNDSSEREESSRVPTAVITASIVQEKLKSSKSNSQVPSVPHNIEERRKQGSWLENFRRQKQLADVATMKNSTDQSQPIRTSTTGMDSSRGKCVSESNTPSVRHSSVISTALETEENDIEVIDLQHNGNNVSNGIERHETKESTISDHVSMKIQRIKERENILACRRLMLKELRDKKPRGMNDTTPILFHEESTFERPFHLLPLNQSTCSDTRGYSLVVRLSSSYEILTTGGGRPLDTDLEKNYSYIALLAWLLSLLEDDSLPFRVLGLIQCAWSGDTIQLNIRVSRVESGPQKLKQFLKCYTLRQVCSNCDFICHDTSSNNEDKMCTLDQISNALLSSFIEIDKNSRGFDWSVSESASFYWAKIVTEEQCKHWLIDDQYDIENALVAINSRSVLPGRPSKTNYVFWLLKRCQLEGLDIAGIRLLHGNPISNSLCAAMAFRGHCAVNSIRTICGSGMNSVFHNITNGWLCSRFSQTVDQELAKYFGPRLTNYSNIESLIPSASPSSLVYVQPSDLLMLVSPICPDIGWILHVTAQRGLPLIGCSRIKLSQSVAEEIGMNSGQIEVFSKSGICHLLLFRYENILNHASTIVNECHDYLTETSSGANLPHPCYLYYAMPYASKLLETLEATKMHQLPEVHELSSTVIPSPVYEDCESYSFILIISETNQEVLSEVLDQCSKHDLLAIKCIPQILPEHLKLLEKEFQLHLSHQMRQSHRLVSSQLVYRGLYLHQCLHQIQTCLKQSKNMVFAYTVDHWHTYRLITSFFSPDELKSEPRRRQAKNFYPVECSEIFDANTLVKEMSASHANIDTAFSTSINKKPDTLQYLITLWNILDSDGFTVQYLFLKSNQQLDMIVQRPNAVFKLLGLVEKNSILNFTNLPSCLEESEQLANNLMAEINEPNIQKLNLTLSNEKSGYDEVNLVLIREPLLLEKSQSNIKAVQILSFLHRKGFKMIGVRLFTLPNQMIQGLKRHKLFNYNQDTICDEDRYLALLFSGRLAAMTTRDLLRNDSDLSSLVKSHGKNIYLTESCTETLECAKILFNCILENPIIKTTE